MIPFTHCNVCGVRLCQEDIDDSTGMCGPCYDGDSLNPNDEPHEERETCDDCGGTGYDRSALDDGTEDFDICKTCWGHD